MADISKIKMPDNQSYDLKDVTARQGIASCIKEPVTDGTSGQVLVTDGNGGRSWATRQDIMVVHMGGANFALDKTWQEIYDALETKSVVMEWGTEGNKSQLGIQQAYTYNSGNGNDYVVLTVVDKDDTFYTYRTNSSNGYPAFNRSDYAANVADVQINGTSIVNNKTANIPIANSSTLGVVIPSNGLYVSSAGLLMTNAAGSSYVKEGTSNYYPIVPGRQHESVFFGLAKAAGVDLKDTNNITVGTYPDASKAAIQNMLGITSLFANEETSTAIAAHTVNSIFMMDGKLHRATSAIAIGDAVTVGTNCEIVKADEVFTKSTDIPITFGTGAGSVKTKDFTYGSSNYSNISSGIGSYAFGFDTVATGNGSFAEGSKNKALAGGAHAEGQYTMASGVRSHAEGWQTCAFGAASHAENVGGRTTITITGEANSKTYTCSSVELLYINAYIEVNNIVKRISQIDADNNTITLNSSFGNALTNQEATVYISSAGGDYSHTEGMGTTAWTVAQHVQGKYNIRDDNFLYADIVGNGTSYDEPSNAFALDWNGNGHYGGYVYVGCNADSTGGIRLPHDIQINGASIVSSGIANVPMASDNTLGVVKASVNGLYGICIAQELINNTPTPTGEIGIAKATNRIIKSGAEDFHPIVPSNQHSSVFYGLSKVAGVDLANETVTVGTYPEASKTAIQTMLGAQAAIEVIRL